MSVELENRKEQVQGEVSMTLGFLGLMNEDIVDIESA